jgi:hypothetical protein
MNPPTDGVDPRLDDLSARIGAIEERLRALELRSPAAPLEREAETAPPLPVAAATAEPTDRQSDIALFGRSLIGIGGAYLLRALAESHLLPQVGGVALGIVYAALWGYLAWRQAGRGEPHAPTFSAGVAAVVIYPLAWEATARFGMLSRGMALGVILAASAGLLLIAYERRLASPAWIAAAGSIASCSALVLDSTEIGGPLIVIALVGAATWWMAEDRKWILVSWPACLVSALLAVVASMQAISGRGPDTPDLTTLVLCGTAVIYGAVIGGRPLARGEDLNGFDLLQVTPLLVICLSGSAYISSGLQPLQITVPLALGLISGTAYSLALRLSDAELKLTRIYFGSVAAMCGLTASAILTTPRVAGLLWGALAIVAAAAATFIATPLLTVHAALYAFGAALAPMLLIRSVAMLTGIRTTYSISGAESLIILAIAAATVISLMRQESPKSTAAHLSRLALFAMTCLLAVAAFASLMVRLIASDAASSAAVRSATIALASVGLAFLARIRLFRDASVLVYPLLAVGAAKFVLDDFLGGRAATLFITLAIYGLALLIVSKFRRVATA